MKKIMILMLSLAVLFSFAACDNSSTTPVDPENPDVDVTTGFTGPQTENAAKALLGLIDGTSSSVIITNEASATVITSISDLLGIATDSSNEDLIAYAEDEDNNYTRND